MDNDILNHAKQLQAWSSECRRHLHQHPELSLQEKNTAAYCKSILQKLGYQIKDSWGYGFTADLTCENPKKTLALRADMDALPIQEQNTHEFISKNTVAAHMCGHDSHMTIALTAARLLAERKSNLQCNVRFLFQPSEEKIPGGALGMIEQGCLNGVDEVYGLHNDPGTLVGKIRTRVGPLMAAGDRFDLLVTGRGCHAARPQDGLDPLVPTAQLILDWQNIVPMRKNHDYPAVLGVTQFLAGDTFNVIPDTAKVAGTVRTFDAADRDFIENSMRQAVTKLVEKNYRCEFDYLRGYDAVINHEQGVQQVVAAATTIIGAAHIDHQTEPAGWAEDFAYYLQHCPGAFFFLGSGNPEKNITEPLHSARFDIDEDALPIGAAIMAELVLTSGAS